mgnify:CR=1 FL=1
MLRQRVIHPIGKSEIELGIHDLAIISQDTIAEGDALYVSSSGYIARARADASGTMHAIGVAVRATSSGNPGPVRTEGELDSGNYSFSGYIGRLAYVSVATAGAITAIPPAASGNIEQVIGVIAGRTKIIVRPGRSIQRGGGLY